MMRDVDREALMVIVRGAVATTDRGLIEHWISMAHGGWPDGVLVTDDNLHLFRQYRNSVSGSASALVDEAIGQGSE